MFHVKRLRACGPGSNEKGPLWARAFVSIAGWRPAPLRLTGPAGSRVPLSAGGPGPSASARYAFILTGSALPAPVA